MTPYVWKGSQFSLSAIGLFWQALADTLKHPQIDQDVDQCVLIGDGSAVAQIGPFDAQSLGLTVDAFDGGALLVDVFVGLAIAVKGIA